MSDENFEYSRTGEHLSTANDLSDTVYNYEDRSVRFAGEVKLWYREVSRTDDNEYYGHQLMRSSGSSALNYGEAQGTVTTKDFIFKMSLVHKEIRESEVILRILAYGVEDQLSTSSSLK